MRKIDFGLGYSDIKIHSKVRDFLVAKMKNMEISYGYKKNDNDGDSADLCVDAEKANTGKDGVVKDDDAKGVRENRNSPQNVEVDNQNVQGNMQQNSQADLSNIYTNISGLYDLKLEVAKKFKRLHKKQYSVDEVFISNGARGVVFTYLLALKQIANRQNKELRAKLLIPYWGQYTALLDVVGVEYDEYHQLKDVICEQGCLNVLCFINPGNPDGKLYVYDELKYIVDLMNLKDNLYVISDEVYSDIVFDNKSYLSIVSLCNENLKSRLMAVSSCSKANEMSGWRIGFAVVSVEIHKLMTSIQRSISANVSNLAQYAGLAALKYEEFYLADNVRLYQKKRDFVIDALKDYFDIDKVDAGLFLLVKIAENAQEEVIDKMDKVKVVAEDMTANIVKRAVKDINMRYNMRYFCDFMLKEFNVVVFPGEKFNVEGVFRMCFARSFEDLQEGCDRLIEGVKRYLR